MCHYLTAVVPANTDLQAAAQLCDRYLMSFERLSNPFIEAQLAGNLYLRATRAYCDCSTPLGSLRSRKAQQHHPESRLEKLSKKGWSRHKIERWLEEKNKNAERLQQEEQQSQEKELSRWHEFISSMLSDGFTRSLGLMLHFYSGRLEEEKILIKRVEHRAISNFDKNEFLNMDEDVLYLFS